MQVKTFLSVCLSAWLLVQPLMGQNGVPAATDGTATQAAPSISSRPPAEQPDYTKGAVWWPNFYKIYKPSYVPAVDLSDSDRLQRLERDGNLYLSLDDAIALAIENNLDIAYMRFEPLVADTDILRARAGAQFTGAVPSGGNQILQSVANTASLTSSTPASVSGSFVPNNVPFVATTILNGPPVPTLDPMFTSTVGWSHASAPQSNTIVSGTNTLVTESTTNVEQFSKSFMTGSTVALVMNNATLSSSSIRNQFNPSLNSSLALNFTQSLTQGFGRSMNTRYLRIARNSREASDLAFKQQVVQTIAQVSNLYWDLVSFIANVSVQRQSVALAERLYNDNKRQVEIGTLAPLSIVQAEAQVASSQQALIIAQTQVQQQETLLKNAISKGGLATPAFADAHIVPTTSIAVPPVEPVEPVQDLIASALQSRAELAQSRIRMTNSDIALKATKQALLPTVNFVGSLSNNALAGQVNPDFTSFGAPTPPNALFLGGFGNNLSQIFDRKFPNYSVGVNLVVPLRNRSAQADVATAQLRFRESEVRMRQAENAVRVEVRNALIGVQNARATLDAAIKTRVLQEQSLDAEQKKFDLGAEIIYNVVLAQRDLATARQAEVAALNNYAKAYVELDRSTGRTLQKNNVSIDEAYKGEVSRPPAPLPARPPAQ